MESYLNENFDLTSKNPTDDLLQQWPKLSEFLRNPEMRRRRLWGGRNQKRRFLFTANLSKRMEAEATWWVKLQQLQQLQQQQLQLRQQLRQLQQLRQKDSTDEESDEEGGGDKKDEGGGGKGGSGSSEKKDKPDDSEKKDKEGGGRAGEKKDKTSGELIKMGANKVYGGWFMYGPGTCAEAVVDEPKQEEWLPTVVH